MDIRERIKNVIVKNLVEVKLGTNRPATKSGESVGRDQNGDGNNVGRPSLKDVTRRIARKYRKEGGVGSFRNSPGGEDKDLDKAPGGEDKDLDEAKKGRCWTGYKPTPGKKPYSKGSCKPVSEGLSTGASPTQTGARAGRFMARLAADPNTTPEHYAKKQQQSQRIHHKTAERQRQNYRAKRAAHIAQGNAIINTPSQTIYDSAKQRFLNAYRANKPSTGISKPN